MADAGNPRRHETLVFEATQHCNHACLHCYNCWVGDDTYPRGQLPPAETLRMLGKVLDEVDPAAVAISGGEPMLREDIDEIVGFLAGRGIAVTMITNGSLLPREAVERLASKVAMWELPLLSAERSVHDRLSGRQGAFDDATLAMAEIAARGGRLVAAFVATALNLEGFVEAAELALALGAEGIMLNRFNPGGRGREHLGLLQASPAQLRALLARADRFAGEFAMPISCSIAMPPCLFDHDRYEHLGFGFCAAGTERAYWTIDPMGNLRPCNHTPTILGNVRDGSFWHLVDGSAMDAFGAARPSFCDDCELAETCQGGCKAAAEVCTGGLDGLIPLLETYGRQAVKIGSLRPVAGR